MRKISLFTKIKLSNLKIKQEFIMKGWMNLKYKSPIKDSITLNVKTLSKIWLIIKTKYVDNLKFLNKIMKRKEKRLNSWHFNFKKQKLLKKKFKF